MRRSLGRSLIAIFAFFVLGGFLFLNTLYLQDVRHYSALQSGLLTLPMAAMLFVFARISGSIVGSRGPRLPLVIAGVPLFVGAVLLTRLSLHTSIYFLVAAYLIIGIGCGLVNAPISTTAVAGMPLDQAGVAGAIASTSRQVGSALGVAVTGSIVAGGTGLGVHRVESRGLGGHCRVWRGRRSARLSLNGSVGSRHGRAQRRTA